MRAYLTRTATWSALRSAMTAPGMSRKTSNNEGRELNQPIRLDEAPSRARKTGRNDPIPPVATPTMAVFRYRARTLRSSWVCGLMNADWRARWTK